VSRSAPHELEFPMSTHVRRPNLRLVGVDPLTPAGVSARNDAREIARENQAAAHNAALNPADPRWVLAVAAYSKLEGTTLTPERRAQVIRTARVLGIRPFDANVIIALAQDRARRGEDIGAAIATIRAIPRPEPVAGRRAVILLWCAALATASLAIGVLIRWITRR